jgi:transposase
MKKSEFSQLFNISPNTIDLWLKRPAETGDYQALPNQPPGNNNKIVAGRNSVISPRFMGIKRK